MVHGFTARVLENASGESRQDGDSLQSASEWHDLAVAYTPGVAEPCKEIKKAPDMAFEYTCRGNMAGICTDGTRVLGLGDIGAAAAMPVMEGKAVLFKRFGGVDAIPVCINEKDPDKFVAIVKALETSFAAINLEDMLRH